MVEQDTSLLVKERNLDAWGGYSPYLRRIGSSVYLTGRYNYRRVSRGLWWTAFQPGAARSGRPAGRGGTLPRKILHGQHDLRIRTREYLATGYKAELTTGYSWGEFNDAMYLGMSYETVASAAWATSWADSRWEATSTSTTACGTAAPWMSTAVVLQPVPLPAQPHPPVPRLQLHPGVEPRRRAATRASDSPAPTDCRPSKSTSSAPTA